MKKLLYLILAITIAACGENSNSSDNFLPFLNKKKYHETRQDEQRFEINPNVPNKLITAAGILIDIGANSIKSKNKKVTIKVLEAISLKDIVAKKLYTQSNGAILSSAGMFEINTNEKSDSIVKPIKAYIPTLNYDHKMNIYKGEIDSTGGINWIAPTQLPKSKNQLLLEEGEAHYKSKCASCHSTDMYSKRTGPGLAGLITRRDKKGIYAFIRNPAASLYPEATAGIAYTRSITDTSSIAVHEGYDAIFPDNFTIMEQVYYNRCVMKTYLPTVMSGFPELTEQQLDAMFTYIENIASKNEKYASIAGVKTPCDSCAMYKALLYQATDNKREILINNNDDFYELKQNIPPNQTWTDTKGSGKIIPNNAKAVYYEINIETFGWYNIDKLLESEKKINLKVAISNNAKPADVITNLIVPNQKIFASGGLLSDNKFIGFNSLDGNIALPIDERCIITCIKEADDGFVLFDMQEFRTQASTMVTLNPKRISLQDYKNKISGLQLEGINHLVKESKNANAVREIDAKRKDAEKWKPTSCDCGDWSENGLLGGSSRPNIENE